MEGMTKSGKSAPEAAAGRQARKKGPGGTERDKVPAEYAGLLRGAVRDKLRDRQYYKLLLKKAPGRAAKKALGRILKDELAHLKAFRAALFSAVGRREKLRAETLSGLAVPPYALALQERMMEERAAQARYGELAKAARDHACLKGLFERIADDEGGHALLLRGMLGG